MHSDLTVTVITLWTIGNQNERTSTDQPVSVMSDSQTVSHQIAEFAQIALAIKLLNKYCVVSCVK